MARRGPLCCSLAASLAIWWPAMVAAGGPADRAPAPAAAPGEATLQQLETDAREAGLDASVVREPVAEARRSLKRARGARAAGDESHAAMLDRLAVDWREVAQAIVRAAGLETSARVQARRALELKTRVDRARALLAEQQAHRWRLQAELERLGARPAPKAEAAPGQPNSSQGGGGAR